MIIIGGLCFFFWFSYFSWGIGSKRELGYVLGSVSIFRFLF